MILSILKIIGIILLIALAVIVTALLIILFWPVQYYADCHIPEKELGDELSSEDILDGITADAGFHWFLHILRGSFRYPEHKQFTVKLLWIKLFPKPQNKAANKGKKVRSAAVSGKKTGDSKAEHKAEHKAENKAGNKAGNKAEKEAENRAGNKADINAADKEKSNNTDSNDNNDSNDKNDNTSNPDSNADDSFHGFILALTKYYHKIIDAINNQKTAVKKAIYTISGICDKISDIKKTIEDERFKSALHHCIAEIASLWRSIKPRRTDIYICGGTGDPALTADVMAFYSAIYAISFGDIVFEPDFDRKMIQGDVHIRGHITIFRVIVIAAKLYFDKDLKWVVRRFKKNDSSNQKERSTQKEDQIKKKD